MARSNQAADEATGRRVVLVAGGSSGIGLAAARRFAEQGARLVLLARSESALAAAARTCQDAGAAAVEITPGDVTVRADVDRAVQTAVDDFGRLDVVVHTAAVMAYGSVADIPAAIFDRVVTTLVTGTLHVAQAVVPVFRRQHAGTLIAVNSIVGSVTVPRMSAYTTAKWGQRALLRSLQQELRADRVTREIRVCIVSPSAVNTPIYDLAANYLGREARPPWPVTTPEQVAAVITRLADHPRDGVSVPVGVLNPLIINGFRVLPALYDRLVAPLFEKLCLTDGPARRPAEGNVAAPLPDLERVHGRWPDRP